MNTIPTDAQVLTLTGEYPHYVNAVNALYKAQESLDDLEASITKVTPEINKNADLENQIIDIGTQILDARNQEKLRAQGELLFPATKPPSVADSKPGIAGVQQRAPTQADPEAALIDKEQSLLASHTDLSTSYREGRHQLRSQVDKFVDPESPMSGVMAEAHKAVEQVVEENKFRVKELERGNAAFLAAGEEQTCASKRLRRHLHAADTVQAEAEDAKLKSREHLLRRTFLFIIVILVAYRTMKAQMGGGAGSVDVAILFAALLYILYSYSRAIGNFFAHGWDWFLLQLGVDN